MIIVDIINVIILVYSYHNTVHDFLFFVRW